MDNKELSAYLKRLTWGETADTICLLHDNEAMKNATLSFDMDEHIKELFPYDTHPSTGDMPGSFLKIVRHGRFVKTPRHNHDSYEIMYVREGCVTHLIDDKELEIRSGSFLFMAPGTFHETKPCGLDDIAVNVIIGPKKLSNMFFTALSENELFTSFFLQHSNARKHKDTPLDYLCIECGDHSDVYILMSMLLCEYFEPGFVSGDSINALFTVLLNKLYQVWKKQNNIHVKNDDAQSSKVVHQAVKYISVHYEDVSLNSLSKQFGYAPKYLGRLLVKETGKSFTELKQRAALQQACILLTHSNMPIAAIAQETGFSNVTFFTPFLSDILNFPPRNTENRMQILSNYSSFTLENLV